jgi:hypothetical protein
VGSTIVYAFMQAAGLVNDHTLGCFRACRSRRSAAREAVAQASRPEQHVGGEHRQPGFDLVPRRAAFTPSAAPWRRRS